MSLGSWGQRLSKQLKIQKGSTSPLIGVSQPADNRSDELLPPSLPGGLLYQESAVGLGQGAHTRTCLGFKVKRFWG